MSSPAETVMLAPSLSRSSNTASFMRDGLFSSTKGEVHRNQERGDIKATTKSRPGFSLIGLSTVFTVILSWYLYPTDNDIQQQRYEEDDPSPWTIWHQGFDFTKQREFWIADEDLPDDIAADLQSTNEAIVREATIRRQLDPSMWETFDFWEIHHYFACDKAFASTRPVWSEQLFRDTRDFYHDFVENDDWLFRNIYQATDTVYDMSQNAVPYQSGNMKGRGLKAARDIKQHELIIQSTNNTIVFNNGHSFRKFLFAMNERFSDPGMVCDVLIWAWVQDTEGEIPFAGVVDLDNGNLLNDYFEEEEEEEKETENDDREDDSPNVRCRLGGVVLHCFASKDIMKGEELLGDYEDFESYYSWPSMGL